MFVAHSHTTPIIAISMTRYAKAFCKGRIFPDRVVYTGKTSCCVPYADPGTRLPRAIIQSKELFVSTHDETPIAYVLQNHEVITTGTTADAAETATLMSTKAANAMLKALRVSNELTLLDENEIAAILNWPDEHYHRARLAKPENM